VLAVAAPVAALLAVASRVAELLGARVVEPLFAHVCPLSVVAGLAVPVAVAIGWRRCLAGAGAGAGTSAKGAHLL